MNYNTVKNRIPELIKSLESVKTEYAYEKNYIGESIGYLALLLDILEMNNETR